MSEIEILRMLLLLVFIGIGGLIVFCAGIFLALVVIVNSCDDANDERTTDERTTDERTTDEAFKEGKESKE